MRLLMIDNYDSFTYNIVQYFGELGAQVEVFRNDEITVTDNDDARHRLNTVADAFLIHNRQVAARCDDSLMMMIDHQESHDFKSLILLNIFITHGPHYTLHYTHRRSIAMEEAHASAGTG